MTYNEYTAPLQERLMDAFDEMVVYLEVTPQEIEEKIQMFKEDGCILFQ